MPLTILILAAILVWREHFHAKTQAELLNKLMSRNYHEYQVSQKVGKPEQTFPAQIRVEEDEIDLSILNSMGPL